MRNSILAAASVVALGIGSVGVVHAALTSTPSPSLSAGQTGHAALGCNPGLSSSSGQNIREFGYGVPQVWAKYQPFYLQQHAQIGKTEQHAELGTIRELEFPGG
jgi:hypothetical protein